MSHMHVPDGVLPWWLWTAGWAATLAMLWLVGRVDPARGRRRVPMLAVVSALMLVGMSTEIVPIAYHINLTVVGGVLIGPALSFAAAFIVVMILALLGHGGITVAGLNTLLIASEMVIGWAAFTSLRRIFGSRRVRLTAVVSTVLTLALTTGLLVGIIALSGGMAASRETGALDPETLRITSPFSSGIVSQGLLGGEEPVEEEPGEKPLSVRRFATIVFVLGPFGWALEAAITALILGYIARVRPSLIFIGLPHERILPGDESGGH